MTIKTPSFSSSHTDFARTLNQRVHQYFASKKISQRANAEMYIKTIFMFLLYGTPYVLIMTGVLPGAWALAGIVFMGLGLAGIGLSVMHDANHGAYSSKQWVNEALGYSLNFLGAHAFNWKLQHNVLHHTYTNIHDHDEDISPRGALRFCPSTPWNRFHRYQHWYAWLLYGLMTIVWLLYKDFARLIKYQKNGLAKKMKGNIAREWAVMLSTKALFVLYAIVLPVLYTPFTLGQVLLGVFMMHYIAGFILAIIFQPAHVSDESSFPLPNENHTLELSWAAHQLHTTANFSQKHSWFSWYVGGLNFQVEHHLFPNICHVHYRHISDIVRSTAQEYNLPYKSFDTFLDALRSHTRLLKQLGNPEMVASR